MKDNPITIPSKSSKISLMKEKRQMKTENFKIIPETSEYFSTIQNLAPLGEQLHDETIKNLPIIEKEGKIKIETKETDELFN